MSYDLTAYVRSSELPAFAVLRREIEKAGVQLNVPDTTDLAAVEGFLPVVLEGVTTGFEVFCNKITERQIAAYTQRLERSGEKPGEYLEILTTCDLRFDFFCTSDPRERAAARIVATVVAKACAGWFGDPQTGT